MRYLALAPLFLAGAAVAASSEFGALEEITFDDIGNHDLFGAGCNFTIVGESNAMLFIGASDGGHLKIDGAIVTLEPETASREVDFGGRDSYASDRYRARLTVEGKGVQTGYEVVDYNGELTVTDAKGGVLFTRKGLVECGA